MPIKRRKRDLVEINKPDVGNARPGERRSAMGTNAAQTNDYNEGGT